MFRVGVTRDFLRPDGQLGFGDIGLSRLDGAAGVEWNFFPEPIREVTPAHAADYDAILLLAPRITPATLAGSPRLSLVARFGVGYDNVDVAACTKSGVALTITPDGVRRPVAAAVLTFLLALAHKLLIKDRLTREGGWARKLDHMGMGLKGRTLGLIGLGNIGREVFRLVAPLEMRHLAADPFVHPADVAGSGIALVELETLLRESDFVVVCCALTEGTRKLLNAERLSWMKSSAYLINVARGPIVDQGRAHRHAARAAHSGRCAGRFRAGAGRSGRSAAVARQRDSRAACAVLDGRVLLRQRAQRRDQHSGDCQRASAAERRQPGGARFAGLPGETAPLRRSHNRLAVSPHELERSKARTLPARRQRPQETRSCERTPSSANLPAAKP